MLNRGTNYYIVGITLLCLLYACENKREDTSEKRLLCKQITIQQAGYSQYLNIFNAANDSLKSWTDQHLASYALYEEYGWYLDSLVCFNTNVDRCVIALSYQLPSSSDHDGMECLYGAKIKNKWYFFRGGGQFHLSREFYVSKDSLQYPLSFKHLNDIAVDEIYRGYIKQNDAGQWEVNDAFFTHHFEGVGWGDFENQSHRDTAARGKRFTDKKEYYENIYLRD